MGKYIFSGGQLGIWEVFRPILHPLLIGLFWKIGLNPILIGKLLDLLFSLICVYLVYKIAKETFNEKIALVSALLFGLTPLFIMFTGLVNTEPLALLLGLLGIYFFIKARKDVSKSKNYLCLISGIFLGLSFLSKFTQGIWFAAVFCALFISWLLNRTDTKERIISLFLMGAGFLISVFPFLLLNQHLYRDLFLPFSTGSWIVTTYAWLYNNHLTYYLTQFFFRNWFYMLFFVYLFYFVKEKQWKDEKKLSFLLAIIFTLIYFLYLPRKEVRYLITALPFLAICSGFVLYRIYNYLKFQKKPVIRPISFVFLCSIVLLLSFNQLNFERAPDFQEEALQIIEEQHINGTILSSDPFLISVTDFKVVTFNGMEFAEEAYQKEKENYQLIFINDCDFICPLEDPICAEKTNFLDLISRENKIQFQEKIKNCTYTFFLNNGTPRVS